MSKKVNVETDTEISLQRKRPTILFASDSPYYPTGFARQCGSIANMVSEIFNWDTHYLGWQTRGNPPISGFNYKVHGVKGNAMFGKDSYNDVFHEISPDIIFTQGDAHMVDVLARIPRPFWLLYYPLDGDPINGLIADVLKKVDVPIAMSKYGKNLTESQLKIKTEYIPHGVDTNNYSPINKVAARKMFFDMYGIRLPTPPEDLFIFGCVARLNKRKHHMRLLEAFRMFLNSGNKEEREEKRKKCFLYLHLDAKDPLYIHDANHDYFFLEQIEVRGIDMNVIITPPADRAKKKYSFTEGIPDQDLSILYNCFDVHVLPTGGEGFGIPIVEAMACGLPSIITDYTTTREFLVLDDDEVPVPKEKMRGIAVPPKTLYMERCGVRKAWIDVRKLAQAMQTYWKSEELRKQHGDNARQWAVDHYDWKVVNKMWVDLFERINTNVDLVI